eukprot:3102393-Rhodomonas_salina.2
MHYCCSRLVFRLASHAFGARNAAVSLHDTLHCSSYTHEATPSVQSEVLLLLTLNWWRGHFAKSKTRDRMSAAHFTEAAAILERGNHIVFSNRSAAYASLLMWDKVHAAAVYGGIAAVYGDGDAVYGGIAAVCGDFDAIDGSDDGVYDATTFVSADFSSVDGDGDAVYDATASIYGDVSSIP